MKVLSLAWKYHPSTTSGVGVACEGLNNALSKIVDLTVIYPKVSKIKVKEEIVLSGEDLSDEQLKQIKQEYIEVVKEKNYEIALQLDPYFTTGQAKGKNSPKRTERDKKGQKRIGYKETEKILYDDVDIFGESVRDKIFLYNRLVEALSSQLEFDIIHAHDWMTFLAGISLKNRYSKPLVLHVHSLEYDRVGHSDVSWVYDIERFAMSKADLVITTSNYTKGIIKSNYGLSGDYIFTIYNAASIPAYKVKNISKKNGVFKVLFAGRIDGNKGIEYFINIARVILKKSDEVEFIVVGRGLGKVNFDRIEGFNEISSKFSYLGFIERDKLFELYNDCDVLCMPSISEPFGLTAIEAASVGLPVILSTKTGASEVLVRTPKADFWDIDKFAHHILSIKGSVKLRERIITNNRQDISNLSWDSSASSVLKLYKKLLDR